MCPTASSGVPGFWYSGDPDQEPGRTVLKALRDYRAAEQEMRRRARDSLGINEKDMQALRYLMRAHEQGNSLGPTEVSRLLAISTASTTALIDRLVSSGHIRRQLHPTDRRALELVPTENSSREMRELLGPMHHRMMAVAASLSTDEAEIVAGFLQRLTDVVDEKPAAAENTGDGSAPS
ncbi:MarR family winged helix-turn-helix transcriptional regulator [Arthrobacter sp. G119Y2]|uniref:MarR family winged helix-turn-helix transcriptional regulator n=1 Tax=Arthrobacter sp. G119Y2 TaxID=3134965 RepID=UPI0031196540